MHTSSLAKMRNFLKQYLRRGDVVLDVGSAIVNGDDMSYRSLLMPGVATYIGLDVEAGDNVDIVVKGLYHWEEVETNSVDIVISGQALEHTEFFWEVFKEMVRVLKPDGFMCVIVPKVQKTHRYPVDCWRIYPDGMRALAKYAEIKCISATADHIANYRQADGEVFDCIGVFQK